MHRGDQVQTSQGCYLTSLRQIWLVNLDLVNVLFCQFPGSLRHWRNKHSLYAKTTRTEETSMAKDPGSRIGSARLIKLGVKPRVFKEEVGGTDRFDIYRLELKRSSNIRATLSGLRANADLALLNRQGKMIQQSRRAGRRKEQVGVDVESGVYFVRVRSRGGKTRYNLRLALNTAPTLATNAALEVRKGRDAKFGKRFLQSVDREQSANKLVYTLTSTPQNGFLQFNNTVMAEGSRFTQADIDDGKVKYNSYPGRTRLTDDIARNASVEVSGSNVVWSGSDGTDAEIYYFNGSKTTKLTDNNLDDRNPKISGSNIVWSGFDGTDYEIFFNNGSSTIQLTNNGFDDASPQISGSNVVWSGFDGTDYEIFLYNGSSTIQLTTNSVDDSSPQISGSNVVWSFFDGNDFEISFFNGSNAVQLTNNNTDDLYAQVSGSNVVWSGFDGNDYEIFLNNGTTSQLTFNNFNDELPQISGSNLVWQGLDGSDTEIYHYNGSVVQLTNNNASDLYPRLWENNVVWQSLDGGDYEILYFDGSNTRSLTNNRSNDVLPKISGFNLVWQVEDQTTSEVYYRNLATSDSFNFTVTDGRGAVTNGTFSFNITES
jgi:beta propeller repeat protein